MRRTGTRIAAGATAGLISTCTMSVVMAIARSAGLLGEPPPRKISRRVLTRLGFRPSRGRALDLATAAAHLGFGAAMGTLFALPDQRRGSVLRGAVFGLGVWAVSYAGLLPKLELMPRPTADRPGRPSAMIAAHLVYGGTLASVLPRLSRAFA